MNQKMNEMAAKQQDLGRIASETDKYSLKCYKI